MQSDQLPFGEGDAAWHFANGDWVTKDDNVYWRLPFYISTWYYGFNKILGPGALEYPPAYHVGYSVFQVIGGDRFVSVYILIAISSFLSAFAIYLFLKKLYGLPTAMVAATAMIFSFREIMVYLWGQRPTILSFAFIPLILYSYFVYLDLHYKQKDNQIYLYITGILLILQLLIHPQGSMLTILVMLLYLIIQSIRKQDFPINKQNIKHLSILLILAIAVIGPFFVIYMGAASEAAAGFEIKDPFRLWSWMELETREGYPNSMGGPPIVFYDMNRVYFPFYYFFVILGIIYLLIRREDKDILMLCWLSALYILIHLDVLGIMHFGRISRFLMGETVLFYAIMAIGIIGIAKLLTKENSKLPAIIAGILIIGLVLYSGQTAFNTLKNAYQYPLRISQEQYEASQWIDQNLPEDAYLYYVGVLTYPKQRFMLVLSHRPGVWQSDSLNYPWIKITHVLIDYSDFARLNDQNMLSQLSGFEQQFKDGNIPLVYDKNNIRIYDVRNPNG